VGTIGNSLSAAGGSGAILLRVHRAIFGPEVENSLIWIANLA
jgi:hypothetical protein